MVIVKILFRVVIVIVLALSAAACGGSDSSTSPSAPTPPSAPFSQTDVILGTGATATQGRIIMVSYTGWLYDPTRPESKGTQFEQNASFSFQLGVGRVIPGWDRGVVEMRVGGLRRLIIPPNLAYGSQANGQIPGNSTLVFDIMLLNVN
jgi:FKBP-type peptidyl-prolyl cis-trans isomerase FkpA